MNLLTICNMKIKSIQTFKINFRIICSSVQCKNNSYKKNTKVNIIRLKKETLLVR
nr:MAG TPA_asm: hypothetical protein [Caudoviricetes sp.]